MTDGDVDAEEVNQPCPRQKRGRKKSKELAHILNVAKARLTIAQLTTSISELILSK